MEGMSGLIDKHKEAKDDKELIIFCIDTNKS